MKKRLNGELKEFAPNPASPWDAFGGGWEPPRVADHVQRSDGFRGHADAYALFDEMEDKDAHLFSLLQTRKLGVVARPRSMEAGGDGERDLEAAGWLERTLEGIEGWPTALTHLMDGLARGMAVLEIIWGFDARGRIVPAALKPRAAGRFTWDARLWQWRLRETGPGAPATAGDPKGRLLPPRKFIVAVHGGSPERPYGKGLLERVYWHWWFKKHNIRFWLLYNEKFGSPTVVARHRSGLNDAERTRLREVIEALQTDAGVTLPEGITLELLETARAAAGATYQDLAQWCNEEMSRAVLGQTLTSSEGQRSGSLALAQVHNEVRRDYLRADAWWLMDIVNAQLVRPIVELNYGEEFSCPRWRIDTRPEVDRTQEIEVDRQLLRMGVPLPTAYFYEKYGRPAPAGEEETLAYDDANVFQYHLQFGVLTVNEVRAKLGLPAVSWGNRPTSPADTPISPPTPRGSAGEDLGLFEKEEIEEEEEDEAKVR